VDFINQHRERFGVEPICDVLQVAPSTYYAAVSRPASARQIEDEKLMVELLRVYEENQQVYGAEKLWTQMNREDIAVGRDRVARLMRAQGLAGEVRGKVWRTTFPSETAPRPADLVDRKFVAAAPIVCG
jgi:putative transposase